MTPVELETKRQNLHALVKEFIRDFPTSSLDPQVAESKGRKLMKSVVLVSGTTGAFGSNILAVFAQSDEIDQIYAISRPTKDAKAPSVFERHAAALIREGYNVDILSAGKVRMIEGELNLDDFGLGKKQYNELINTVTHVVHNGWKVNLRAPIEDFRPNILSVRKLADFCLRSRACSGKPAKLLFISSNGVLRNANPIGPDVWYREESQAQPDCALGSGYSEAKWVSEHILDEAARQTPLKPTVVRVTQLLGGPSGYWNEKEWMPAMVKSSIYLKRLPCVPGTHDYVRANDAARGLLDMLNTEVPYVHIVHPDPILQLDFIKMFSSILKLPVVHIDEWMDVLKREHSEALKAAARAAPDDSNAQARREFMRKHYKLNPASKIIHFFENEQDSVRGKPFHKKGIAAVWSCLLTSDVAVRESSTMRDLKDRQLGPEDVARWIAKWQEVGFLEKQPVAKANL